MPSFRQLQLLFSLYLSNKLIRMEQGFCHSSIRNSQLFEGNLCISDLDLFPRSAAFLKIIRCKFHREMLAKNSGKLPLSWATMSYMQLKTYSHSQMGIPSGKLKMENQIEFPAKCLIAGLKRQARPMLKGIEYLAGQRASAEDLESCLVCISGGALKRLTDIYVELLYLSISRNLCSNGNWPELKQIPEIPAIKPSKLQFKCFN